jgi:hypothetical protein
LQLPVLCHGGAARTRHHARRAKSNVANVANDLHTGPHPAMPHRSLLLPLLALLALLGWWAWPQLQTQWQARIAPLSQAVEDAARATAPPLQRCRAADGGLLYVQGDCPSGQRAEAMGGGTLNVLPAQRPPASVASAASAPPALRRLADPEGTAELQRRRIERAVQP